MINVNLFETIVVISTINTSLTTSFIQKTKKFFNRSRYVPIYSLIINILFGYLIAFSFTNISLDKALWIGLLSFLESDSLYKSLEGKLLSLEELRKIKK